MAYSGLDELLHNSEAARIFYGSLPDYVRGALIRHSDRITDENSLRDIADSIMHEFT